MAKVITVITIGTIMAIGATFGALNTMFAAVAARARDRHAARHRLPGCAGGGGRDDRETMLLALLAGGLLGGALIAWLLFNGKGASTMGAGSVGKLEL